MSKTDPVLAKQLERLGLFGEAKTTLENARLSHPERTDVREMLQDLRIKCSFKGEYGRYFTWRCITLYLVQSWLHFSGLLSR